MVLRSYFHKDAASPTQSSHPVAETTGGELLPRGGAYGYDKRRLDESKTGLVLSDSQIHRTTLGYPN